MSKHLRRLALLSIALAGVCAYALLFPATAVIGLDQDLNISWYSLAKLKSRAIILDNHQAQYDLGRYERFVNLNFEQSDRWFNLAANGGHLDAMYAVAAGRLAESDLSKQGREEALAIMKKAAQRGHLAAREYLAQNPT